MHLPERQIRRCSNDRPWVDDNFRHLIRRRQRALLGGDRTLYINRYVYDGMVNSILNRTIKIRKV